MLSLRVLISVALCLVTVVAGVGGARAGEPSPAPVFTQKPVATRDGDKVRIQFAVSRPTDVAVFVEDAKGKIIRHLVAGVLGEKPPPPLTPRTLEQSVVWDGQGDYGRPVWKVSGTLRSRFLTPLKIRVALGLGAKFDRVLISDPTTIGQVRALAVGPDGTLYVVMGCGGTGPVWGGEQMVAFNRDGTYARMVQPFPANLPIGRVKGFGVAEVDGRPAPLVHEMPQRNLYAAQGPRKAGMAVTADGTILRLIGGYRTPVKYNVAALDPQGGAPWGRYEGPPLLPFRRGRFTNRPFIAVGADAKWAYLSGLADFRPDDKDKSKRDVAFAAVYRVALPDRTPCTPFVGEPEKPGNDEAHLGGPPHGLAADGRGHLLIADHANDRVVVAAEADGRYVGGFEVENPDCLGVDPATGAVYVTRLTGKGNVELVKFSGWNEPTAVARLALRSSGNPDFPWLMAVDTSGRPPVIWLGSDGAQLLRIEDLGDRFGEPRRINKDTIGNASFVDLSVDRVRGEVYARCGMYWWFRYNEETGELGKVKPGPYPGAAGSQLLAGPDGFLYSPAYNQHLLRFDRTGKPAPWPSTGKDRLYVPVSMTFLTHTLGIRHDGHIFTFQPAAPGGRPPKMLIEYDPAGRPVGGPIIWKVSDTAVGPRFDPQGNIYVAEQIKPLDQPYPPEFASLVGPIKLNATYLEGLKEQIPSMYGSIVKFSPKGGMIHFGGPNPFTGEPRLDPTLATVTAAYFEGHRLKPVKVTGAEWIRTGISHVDLIGCNCENTRFDVDEFGRVFYPDLGRFRVGVLDTNGNDIIHFGGYGNAESAGPESTVPTPDIAFSWLIGVGVTDRYAYMGDSLNRRLLRAKLTYAAEAVCALE